MGLMSEVKVRVKNTFLEFEDESAEDQVQPRVPKALTDSVVLRAQGSGAAPQGDEAMLVREQASFGSDEYPLPAAKDVASPPAAVQQCPLPGTLPVLLGAPQPPVSEDGGQLVGKEDGQDLYVQDRVGKADKHVPAAPASEEGMTTVMLRNLPNNYTRSMVLDLLDTFGFVGKYDFLYLPTDQERGANLGYAFVNMTTAVEAQLVRQRLEGFRRWSMPSSKRCSVGWSLPCQGLDANIERYRNSPLMHSSVPDEFKPIVLANGQRVSFPRPTKKLRKPKPSDHRRF